MSNAARTERRRLERAIRRARPIPHRFATTKRRIRFLGVRIALYLDRCTCGWRSRVWNSVPGEEHTLHRSHA